MEEGGFLSDILRNGVHNEDDGDLDGLDNLEIQMTQDTQFADVEEIDEVQATRSNKKISKRTKNFFFKEDEVICDGWLKVSKDPIHGANQTRSSFWRRIHAYFNAYKVTAAERSQSSIMHRWLTIQAQVNKYCSCVEAIDRRPQSGTTIKDKITAASKMYTNLDKFKKSFTLIHCYNILKHEDKWAAKRIELAELEKEQKKPKKASKKSRARDEDSTMIDVDTEDMGDEQTPPKKKVDGIKKAKQNIRRGGAAEICLDAIEKMWAKKESLDKEKEKAKVDRFRESIELDKERASNEAKIAEAKLMKEEEKIMQVDKSKLDALQLEYYEFMQRKIIARRMAN